MPTEATAPPHPGPTLPGCRVRVTESGKVRAKQHTCVWKYKVCNHHVGIKIYSGDVEGGGRTGRKVGAVRTHP